MKINILERIFLLSSSIFFIVLFSMLHFGLYPTVFSDEWFYSSAARLLPLSQSIYPSYLFLYLYKNTNYCGTQFLDCARFANACFFALSYPIIYFLASRFTSKKMAAFIAFIALIGPIHTYSSYFMPESLYYFLFWIFAAYVLSSKQTPLIFGSTLGLILCLMSLVKMHAIFIFSAFIIFLLLRQINQDRHSNLKHIVLIVTAALMIFVFSRFVFEWLLMGKMGFHLFGIKYQNNIRIIFNMHQLQQTLTHITIPIIGHLTALSILFSIPMIVLGENCTQKTSNMILLQLQNISYFTLSCLILLLSVTIYTTTAIVGWDPYEAINRIHMRYYNFIFPLFFLIAAGNLGSLIPVKSYKIKLLMLILVGFNIYALLQFLEQYKLSFIDCPELFGVAYHQTFLKICCVANLLMISLYFYKPNTALSLYLFIFLPFTFLIASYFVNIELRAERFYVTDQYDRAGQFVHKYFNNVSSDFLIVGEERAGLYKTLFYIDNVKTSISEVPLVIPIEFAKIPPGKKWILFVGNYPTLKSHQFVIKNKDFTVYKII